MVNCDNVLFTTSTRNDISCPVVQRVQPNFNKFFYHQILHLSWLPTFNSATPSPPSFLFCPVVQSLRKNTNAKRGEYTFSLFILPFPHLLLTLPLLLSSPYLLPSSYTMLTNLIFSPSTLPPLHPVNSLLHVSLLVQLGHLFKLPPVNLQKKYLSDKNPKKQNQPPPWRPSTFRRHLGLCLPLHVHSPW